MSPDERRFEREKVAWRYERDAAGKYSCGYCDRDATHVVTESTFDEGEEGIAGVVHHLADDVCDRHLESFHGDVEVVGGRFQ